MKPMVNSTKGCTLVMLVVVEGVGKLTEPEDVDDPYNYTS
jgi:hypothetical protein